MMDEKKGTKEYWSMTEGVFNCLIDKKRSLAFKKAIYNTVKKGDVVVDVGTGSGILAMFAADAGAQKVYAVEYDENNLKTLKENFKINGFGDKIILIKGDARKVRLPEKVDVIIAEMIATGLIEEQQIPAMNNMLKYAKKNVKVLLKSYENYIDLVFNKDRFYNYKMKILRYEYSDVVSTKSNVFSDKIFIGKVNFSKINKLNKINKKVIFHIKKDGIINGIRMNGRSTFYNGIKFNDSFSYSFPVIFPVNNLVVKKGEKIIVKLCYKLCGGLKNLRYSIMKI